jgi:hypothetical protein
LGKSSWLAGGGAAIELAEAPEDKQKNEWAISHTTETRHDQLSCTAQDKTEFRAEKEWLPQALLRLFITQAVDDVSLPAGRSQASPELRNVAYATGVVGKLGGLPAIDRWFGVDSAQP